MKHTYGLFCIFVIFSLTGCAPKAWLYYNNAMECHFKYEGDCSELYQKAIKKDSKLPGVHASYAVHLAAQGQMDQAEVEHQKEVKNYPQSQTALAIVFSEKGTTVAEALGDPTQQKVESKLEDTQENIEEEQEEQVSQVENEQ